MSGLDLKGILHASEVNLRRLGLPHDLPPLVRGQVYVYMIKTFGMYASANENMESKKQ